MNKGLHCFKFVSLCLNSLIRELKTKMTCLVAGVLVIDNTSGTHRRNFTDVLPALEIHWIAPTLGPHQLVTTGLQNQVKMTRIGKHARPTVADQVDHIPKKMARILCNTVTQATHECQGENIAKYGVENQQNHNISSNDILLNVTKPEEKSTWRVGLHKRVLNNLWGTRLFAVDK